MLLALRSLWERVDPAPGIAVVQEVLAQTAEVQSTRPETVAVQETLVQGVRVVGS
jgi:hypothetical protein